MDAGRMRVLLAAVIVMGLLILAGVTTIVVTIVHRMSGSALDTGVAAQAVLDEPAGTRIAGVSLAADRVALQLQGGGPDRVLVLDTRAGRVVARFGLRQ
jgi:hypothetical protein